MSSNVSVEPTSKRNDVNHDADSDDDGDINDDFGSTDEVKVFKDEDEQGQISFNLFFVVLD